ncbi:MAG: YraN family protein [Candidatus Falkowbacteria bacterium]|nr:YraN family protein [Candidatus Falkowbacteria bacterium]
MNSLKALGNRGEQIASEHLEHSAYKIIGRNLKLGPQEIDIVAQKSSWTIFVEVKTRTRGNDQDGLLSKQQITNLKKAIIKYALRNRLAFERLRLDLILITANPRNQKAELKHYQDILN